jgi:hypothetical protein
MGIEKRVAPRFSTSLPVGIRFPSGDHREGWGRILNISAGGVLLETRFPIKVGAVVYLTFTLRTGSRLENIRSRVVRVAFEEGYAQCGLQFDDLVDADTLRDVVATLAFESGLPAA